MLHQSVEPRHARRGSWRNRRRRASSCCACPARRLAAFCSCWILVDELHVNTWWSTCPTGGRGSARLLMHRVLAEAARRGPGGPRWKSGNRTRRPGPVRESRVLGRREAAELLLPAGGRCADSLARRSGEAGPSAKLKARGSCVTVPL